MGKKDKGEKKGDGEGLPSTDFMIKPETATPKLDTSKYVSKHTHIRLLCFFFGFFITRIKQMMHARPRQR